MRLSEHFHNSEFTFSQTATRMGREVVIEPDSLVHLNLVDLCEMVLEPLRKILNRPIHVSSGYRPDWLNSAVGGSKSSQHMVGQAVDITVVGVSPRSVAKALIDTGVEFDQLIIEFGQWVHVSYNFANNRCDILKATKVDGKTVYSKALQNDLVRGYY